MTPASPEAFATLSPIMMDYWISFASTLDPNDGKGAERESELIFSSFKVLNAIRRKLGAIYALSPSAHAVAFGQCHHDPR